MLRLNPASRTLIIELLEGALSFKPTGGQAERPISPGVWVIKWFERRTGRQHRIRQVRVYRPAGDRVLARRRAYYNRILPAKRKAMRSNSGVGSHAARRKWCRDNPGRPGFYIKDKTGGYIREPSGSYEYYKCRRTGGAASKGRSGALSNQAAKGAILNPGWPVSRTVRWREASGAHGSYTPPRASTRAARTGAGKCHFFGPARIAFGWREPGGFVAWPAVESSSASPE